MGDDEEATIRTLTSHRQVMTFLIPRHRGRIVDSPGDNLLAEFGSVVDAVQCAVVIQTTLRAENANLPQHRRMEFRIGINLGDVMVEGERIYGDGVNIAARVEGLAEAGGICISGTVFDQVRGKVSVNFEDLGPQQVKNIAEPIRAYRAVLGSGTVSAGPQHRIEVARQDLQRISNLYNSLTSRLGPLLYRGIEDVLHRRVRALKPIGQMMFTVYAISHGFYRAIASTYAQGHPARQLEWKLNEGIPGYLAGRGITGYGISSWYIKDFPNRPIFDRVGLQIGELPLLPDDKRDKTPTDEKWVYARPILERTTATPWSNRLVGILVVTSSDKDADNDFKTAKYQRLVDSVATVVSPYLDALQVLMGEEKL
jgi:hypothetical protein